MQAGAELDRLAEWGGVGRIGGEEPPREDMWCIVGLRSSRPRHTRPATAHADYCLLRPVSIESFGQTAMFLGQYEHATDDKHRVVLPSALRRGMSEEEIDRGFVLVPNDRSECLELHPMEAWEKRIADLERTHDVHRNYAAREFFRQYAGRASRVQCDSQGRFLIPEALRNAVGVEKEVRFVGMVRFVEIWPREGWFARQTEKAG